MLCPARSFQENGGWLIRNGRTPSPSRAPFSERDSGPWRSGPPVPHTAPGIMPSSCPIPERHMYLSSAAPVHAFALLVCLLFGSTTQSAAQERLPSLPQGEPVRVTSDLLPGRSVVIFEGFRSDTLLRVRQSGGPVSLPLSRIEQLETARKDHLTGVLIGAPTGALALTTALAIFANAQGGWMCCGDFGDDFAFSAIFGVPIGGIVGAITGGVVGIRRWDPVPSVADRP